MDEQAIMEFAGAVGGVFTGMAVGTAIWLGDETGLYRAMAGNGPMGADAVADAAGCNRRVVQEWLDGQAAAGLIGYDPGAHTYELSEVGALVLANDESPVFMARGAQGIGSLAKDMEKLVATFRSDGALAWGDHHVSCFNGVEWFFRTGYRANLASTWLPALDGVVDRLEAGASVADVGCGHGASAIAMAQAFPNSTIACIDMHGPSIDAAKQRAAEAGVADQLDFQVADSRSYDGSFDLICYFDCLHDMGDPLGAARHARSRLNEGGSVLLVEPYSAGPRAQNLAENPMAALSYSVSSMICVPCSLAQDGGAGLGAQAGEERLRAVMVEAGFSELVRRAETPFNLILQAR